jgi:exodeoxyribonuclease-1
MNSIIWYDFETSDSRKEFGQIIEAGVVVTDDKLNIKEQKQLRCKLKPNVIPNIGACLVHRASVDQLKSSNLSHYSLIKELYNIIKLNSPAYITGFNSLEFDEEFLRRSYFKSLIPEIYQTNTGGNKRLDILNVARGAHFYDKNSIKTQLSKKTNRPSFKLVDLCEANNIDNGTSHNALVDTLNTLGIGKVIYDNAKTLWDIALTTTSKLETETFILKNKFFTILEYYKGQHYVFLAHHIFFHPKYKWSINWDCKVDPDKYLKMDEKALAKAIDASPKILRTCKTNKSPVLLKSDFALNNEKYSNIDIKEVDRRIKILKDNPEFIEKIKQILLEKAEEKENLDQSVKLFEETIFSGGFANEKDKILMKKFHEVDWKEKVILIENFSEERFQYFAECLIYEESPESLPKSIYNKIHRSFAQRLLSTNKEKWETTSSFFSEVDTLRETKYKDDKEMLEVIEGYNQYVLEIQSKFESA